MAESEILISMTYFLYVILVIVLALIGRYFGKMHDLAGAGTIVGGLVGIGLVYWHVNSESSMM
jgi:hypothetical protein